MTAEIQPENSRRLESLAPTNWWIITGGPSSGKSTLLEELAKRGYKTKPEAARVFIDDEMTHGRTIEQIRESERQFQKIVLRMKEGIEEVTPREELIFWDRGLAGDSVTYSLGAPGFFYETQEQTPYDGWEREKNIIVEKRRYMGVFLLDMLPTYHHDYARTESENKASRIHFSLAMIYRLLGYSPIRVPVMSFEKRVQFVIDKAREIDPSVPNLPSPQLNFGLI